MVHTFSGLGRKQRFIQQVLRSENQRFKTKTVDLSSSSSSRRCCSCHVWWQSPCCVSEPRRVPVPEAAPGAAPQPPAAADDAFLERGVPETHRSLLQGQQRVPHLALQVTTLSVLGWRGTSHLGSSKREPEVTLCIKKDTRNSDGARDSDSLVSRANRAESRSQECQPAPVLSLQPQITRLGKGNRELQTVFRQLPDLPFKACTNENEKACINILL